MSKAVIAIASLCAGLGVFAMIAEMEEDPLTFTTKSETEMEMPSPTIASARDAASITLDAVRAELGPVAAVPSSHGQATHSAVAIDHPATVSGSTPALATPEETPRELVPCSPWQELGPKLGTIHGEPSSRSVRQLC